MISFDPRITPARDDIAAESLRGKVAAERYAAGRDFVVAQRSADLHHAPDGNSIIDNELIFGERFVVYEEKNGWAWGQAEDDHYVGYVSLGALMSADLVATHRIVELASHLYPEPEVKAPPLLSLPFGAKVRVTGERGRFAKVETAAGAGFVPAQHLAMPDQRATDFVTVAERFLGVPYRWGGRTFGGIDCSALVQLSLREMGIAAPRDSDQQQRALGADLRPGAIERLERGDLVFWDGHVAIALDQQRIIHANASAMAVSIDDARAFAQRVEMSDGPIVQISRL